MRALLHTIERAGLTTVRKLAATWSKGGQVDPINTLCVVISDAFTEHKWEESGRGKPMYWPSRRMRAEGG